MCWPRAPPGRLHLKAKSWGAGLLRGVGGLVSIVCGVLMILLGVLIWVSWPLSGAWAVGTLVGVHFIFVGWSTAALGAAARGAAQQVAEQAPPAPGPGSDAPAPTRRE